MYPHGLIEILFVQGKIVEVRSQGEDVSKVVLAKLRGAGIVPASSGDGLQDNRDPNQSYRALFLSLVEEGISIDEEFFRNVIKQCVLDRLYEVDLSGAARFQFKVEMVDPDREFSPTISSNT